MPGQQHQGGHKKHPSYKNAKKSKPQRKTANRKAKDIVKAKKAKQADIDRAKANPFGRFY
jgi:hypothetical protein